MLKPVMQCVLNEVLKNNPEKEKELKSAELGQELLDKLWVPEQKPNTFWGKVKFTLSDGINLPEKLFNRIIDFRVRQGLTYKRKEMQRVLFYSTSAFRKGTEILARGCYLFHHNPQAFKKYAISSVDFEKDIQQSSFNEENIFMPAIGMGPVGIFMVGQQSEQEECRAEERQLPLLSFAPIKYGQNPSQMNSQQEIDKYQELFSEPSLRGFSYDPYRYEPLKKLLYSEHSESNYPATQHNAMVIAINAFNQRLEHEAIKICTHKSNSISSDKQKTL